MRLASPRDVLAGAALTAIFAARAISGVPAGRAADVGAALAGVGSYEAAIPRLDAGAIGAYRAETLWLAAEARLGLWDRLSAEDRRGPKGETLLRDAAARILSGRAATPASAWFDSSLAGVYARREIVQRQRRTVDLSALDKGPWALVCDDGRIAIGLARTAIDRQPTTFAFRDQLTLLLEAHGLREEALRAMADSARILPDFGAHPDLVFDDLPRELVEAFYQAARRVQAEDVPLMLPERRLLSLGLLGRRLGHLEEAEADLRSALAAPGSPIFHAEDAFHLALVLIDRGRPDEAKPLLERASREAVFVPGVASALAGIAESQGRWGEALEPLRELRRRQPRDLGLLLRFADVAVKALQWDQAEEALRWACVVYPASPEPRRRLVELWLSRGDTARARQALDEYEKACGRSPDVVRLQKLLPGALDRRPG